MAETYTKKSELGEKMYDELTGNEFFDFYVGTSNFRTRITELAKYFLGTVSGILRTIGGTGTGSILTTTDTQPVRNKDLIDCKIGSGDTLNITSTELNHCSGLVENVNDKFVTQDSDISAIAGDVEGIDERVSAMELEIRNNYKFSVSKVSDGLTTEFLAADIMAGVNINHENVMVSFSKEDGNSATVESPEGIIINKKSDGGTGYCLDKIIFTTIEATTYTFVIYFSVL